MGFTRYDDVDEQGLPSISFHPAEQHPWLQHIEIRQSSDELPYVNIIARRNIDPEILLEKMNKFVGLKRLFEPKARRGATSDMLDRTEELTKQALAGEGPACIVGPYSRIQMDFDAGPDSRIGDLLRLAHIPEDIREGVLQELRGKEHGGRS